MDTKAQTDLDKKGLPKEYHYILIKTIDTLSDRPIMERQVWLRTIILSRDNNITPIPSNH